MLFEDFELCGSLFDELLMQELPALVPCLSVSREDTIVLERLPIVVKRLTFALIEHLGFFKMYQSESSCENEALRFDIYSSKLVVL